MIEDMKITKLGHCCLLIEEGDTRLLTDPGCWSTAQNDVTGIQGVLITHEHPDHFHLDSLRQIHTHNPDLTLIANRAVAAQVTNEHLTITTLEHGETSVFRGVELVAQGTEHAPLYPGVVPVMNTGYLIAQRLFYPGDALTVPAQPVEILALPIAGPWLTIADALDYAKAVQPQRCFPVHDGMIKPVEWLYRHPARFLPEAGIAFEMPVLGTAYEW